ncbi:MAG: ATP-binding cassette domain-containing protein [Ruminococcaceae bacterium]|nr:ATP-binding cassette domain-containing protein [Oscillospiraceae bacterium]
MIYLTSFCLPDDSTEQDFYLNYPHELESAFYSGSVYPFKIFPEKELTTLSLDTITIFYGGNGSGKSTLLNIIAEKLGVPRSSPYSKAPCLAAYLERCRYRFSPTVSSLPRDSRIVTSDDVFDYLLNVRAINEGLDRRRESLLAEYHNYTDPAKPSYRLGSLEDYEELRRRNEARHRTQSAYVSRRLPTDLTSRSNGESALVWFQKQIGENALYLLDEPENSLSAELQLRLKQFIEDSARFYGCQFILATHSPFLLSLKNATIYNLDARPATVQPWTELPNVRLWFDFFQQHQQEFDD